MNIDIDRENAPRQFANAGIYVLGVAMSLLVIYYAYSLFIVRDRQANFVLGLSIALYYLVEARDAFGGPGDPVETNEATPPARDRWAFLPTRIRDTLGPLKRSVTMTRARVNERTRRVSDIAVPLGYLVLSVVALVAMVYIETNYVRLSEDALITGFTPTDYAFGGMIILLSIDVTRRAFGNVLGGVVLLGIAYALAGPYLPGVLYHSGMTVRQVIRVGILTMDGEYGFILEVGASWVAVYLLLAGFAKAYGVLDWVVTVSKEIGKLTRTGIVHVAVMSSMVMGMITGSGAANTATTGSFTIPMMKEQGVRSPYAGAIEATASIGGQLIPPIMGVAAFIMADLIGIPYVDVVRAGLIPAFLFYFSIVVAVQLLVYKYGWTTTTSRDLDWSKFSDGVYYVIPFAVLIYYLVFLRYTPLTAGLYTVVAMIGVTTVKYLYEERAEGLKKAPTRTVIGLKQGAVDMAPLMAILGSIGVAISMFTRTGLAQRLATLMVGLSGQNLLLLLVLAMIVSLVFGMGMPAPAAYILTASLGATAMIQFGIEAIVAHMFVFYFAMYSSLTPPVGPSTVVGARIADADFLETGKRAMQLALPGFLVPFAFIANSSLILWQWPDTPIVFVVATVSVVGICIATFGFDGREEVGVPKRAVYLTLALVGLFGSTLHMLALPIVGQHVIQLLAAVVLLGVLLYYRQTSDVDLALQQSQPRED